MNVKDIMISHFEEIKTSKPGEIIKAVRADVKANIGHGVSQAYYDKAFGKGGYITAKNIVRCITNARYNSTPAWSERHR